MHIEAYQFGRIMINGKTYSSDVIIAGEQVADGWWRREGHRLDCSDIEALIATHPQVLVVGTGYYGRMEVPPETRRYIADAGIELYTVPTGSAVETFNRLQREYARVVAALHLTC